MDCFKKKDKSLQNSYLVFQVSSVDFLAKALDKFQSTGLISGFFFWPENSSILYTHLSFRPENSSILHTQLSGGFNVLQICITVFLSSFSPDSFPDQT